MMTIQADQNKKYICVTGTAYGEHKSVGVFAMASSVNELAARGAKAVSAEARINVPFSYTKSDILSMKKMIEKKAKELGIEEVDVLAEQGPEAALPIVCVTTAGMADAVAMDAKAGQEIVLTGYVGLEGMLRIAAQKEKELATRFTPAFIKQIKSYDTHIFALQEIDIAKAMGVSVIRQLPQGGVLAGLWDLALETGCGLCVDLKKIAIRQETIEVCEEFRLNPYQLTSSGCMLMLTDHGDELADALKEQGLEASVIGRLTDDNDKIIHNGEEVRYIDRPAPDELKKIF